MKKVLIPLLAVFLIVSCDNKSKNDKGKNESSRDRDDYRNTDKNKDQEENDKDRNTNYSRDEENEDKDKNENYSSGGWSSSDVNEFVTSCVSSAVKEGMQRSAAQNYCECMQQKIENKYPNSSDAAEIADAEMEDLVTRLAKGCLSN
ncbi:MAG: hypothetical protein WBC06_19405 [Chitinophagaceae bacterium]